MFNAIKYTRHLESVGFTREQAEATLNMLYDFSTLNLSTKQDISDLKHWTNQEFATIKHSIADLGSNTRHSIELLEKRMTVKLGSMLLVTVGLLVTLQKIL